MKNGGAAADWRVLTERAGKVLSGYIILAAVALIIEPGWCAFICGTIAMLMLRMTAACGWERNPFFWGFRMLWFGLTAWGQWAVDLVRYRRGSNWHFSGRRFVLCWALPLGLTMIFVILFAVANPVFASGIARAIRSFFDLLFRFEFPAAERWVFWVGLFIFLWALLRMDLGRRFCRGNFREEEEKGSGATRFPLLQAESFGALAVRCLILFNLVFLIQNIMDIEYLWAGMKLPGNMTYAAYAHRGAYPLIATALLAGAMVLVCFAGNGDAKVWHLARRLVYVWLAQNVFLVLSAMLRLGKYVDIYSLTLLRVAALVWMLLVAAGLVLIAIRILYRKRNRWLINANLAVLALVMLICGFCDFRGWVADYNVSHCREAAPTGDAGARAALDLAYLAELGPNSLPALRRIEKDYASAFSPAAMTEVRRQIGHARQELRSWRAWTFRRYLLQREFSR